MNGAEQRQMLRSMISRFTCPSTNLLLLVACNSPNFGIEAGAAKIFTYIIIPNLQHNNNWEMDVICLYSLQVDCPSKIVALITKT
jgi:hypothetical protein